MLRLLADANQICAVAFRFVILHVRADEHGAPHEDAVVGYLAFCCYFGCTSGGAAVRGRGKNNLLLLLMMKKEHCRC